MAGCLLCVPVPSGPAGAAPVVTGQAWPYLRRWLPGRPGVSAADTKQSLAGGAPAPAVGNRWAEHGEGMSAPGWGASVHSHVCTRACGGGRRRAKEETNDSQICTLQERTSGFLTSIPAALKSYTCSVTGLKNISLTLDSSCAC